MPDAKLGNHYNEARGVSRGLSIVRKAAWDTGKQRKHSAGSDSLHKERRVSRGTTMKNLAAVITILLVGIITACDSEDAADFTPKATSPGTTGYQTEEALAEARTRCLHWADKHLNAIQYRKLEQADPQNLTDLERALWRQTLGGGPWRYYPDEPEVAQVEHGGNIHCRVYWAEPVSKRNAAKRNEAFRYRCKQWVEGGVSGGYSRIAQQMNQHIRNGEEPVPIPNQYARIQQWLAMSETELLNSTEPPYAALRAVSRHEYAHRTSPSDITPEADREWRKLYKDEYRPELARILYVLGISAGAIIGGTESCRLYYPQLFYGHWIPIEEDDPDYQGHMVPADMRTRLPAPGEHEAPRIGSINETPIYLPDTVTHSRVFPGYPIGKGSDEEYRICREGSDTEAAGYQYVAHPDGHYCEPSR